MTFKRVVCSTAFAVVGLATNLWAGDDNLCLTHPQFGPPFETGRMIVSTFHVTGVPGSERLIDLTWPSNPLVKLSGSPPDRTEEQFLLFEFDGSNKLRDKGLPLLADADFPHFSISVRAVDKFPLYSWIGILGGLSVTRSLLQHDQGFTYQPSEGMIKLSDGFSTGWQGYFFPDATRRHEGDRTWFRGKPIIGGVEAIMLCDEGATGVLSQCRIDKKIEPLFYRINIYESDPTQVQIAQLEAIADQFINCLIEGF